MTVEILMSKLRKSFKNRINKTNKIIYSYGFTEVEVHPLLHASKFCIKIYETSVSDA